MTTLQYLLNVHYPVYLTKFNVILRRMVYYYNALHRTRVTLMASTLAVLCNIHRKRNSSAYRHHNNNDCFTINCVAKSPPFRFCCLLSTTSCVLSVAWRLFLQPHILHFKSNIFFLSRFLC